MALRCAAGRVYDLLLVEIQPFWSPGDQRAKKPYLTRSNTDTRLPTGESRDRPSGVKSRLPLEYTVPSKFENYITH